MLRELVRKRQELEKRATDLCLRTAAMLRGTFGFSSEELILFGIRARPRNTGPRKRRKKAEAESQQTEKGSAAACPTISPNFRGRLRPPSRFGADSS